MQNAPLCRSRTSGWGTISEATLSESPGGWLTISDIKQVQGYWTKSHMEMQNVQTGHSTVIIMKNPQYDLNVDKSMFTVAKLEKGL